MAPKKSWDDDDGRTIASMQDVGRPSIFPRRERDLQKEYTTVSDESENADNARPWEQNQGLNRQERKWYALGALKAALLIGLVYIVGLGIAILLMLFLWAR